MAIAMVLYSTWHHAAGGERRAAPLEGAETLVSSRVEPDSRRSSKGFFEATRGCDLYARDDAVHTPRIAQKMGKRERRSLLRDAAHEKKPAVLTTGSCQQTPALSMISVHLVRRAHPSSTPPKSSGNALSKSVASAHLHSTQVRPSLVHGHAGISRSVDTSTLYGHRTVNSRTQR
jgi:hypothetical protein